MTWEAFFAAIGAIVSGAFGCALVIREFRRRDRSALSAERAELEADLSHVRKDLLNCRAYAFHLAAMLADRGVEVPSDPHYHDEDDAM